MPELNIINKIIMEGNGYFIFPFLILCLLFQTKFNMADATARTYSVSEQYCAGISRARQEAAVTNEGTVCQKESFIASSSDNNWKCIVLQRKI